MHPTQRKHRAALHERRGPTPWHAGMFVSSLVLVAACTGQIGGDDGAGSSNDDGSCVGCTESGLQVAAQTRFPRLSHRQWEYTVADLFGLDEPTGLSATFAQDLQTTTFDNNFEKLSVAPALWQSYQTAAEDTIELIDARGDRAADQRIDLADLPR